MFDNLKEFEPKDLNGKTLRMVYCESENIGLLIGRDIETNDIYVLAEKIIEEITR